jgi:hypothetical protein
VLAVFLDCLFITAIVAALFILLTGGGVYTIGHLRVSARGRSRRNERVSLRVDFVTLTLFGAARPIDGGNR